LNIKMLNNKAQTKEETLMNVRGIFGRENEDLIASLKQIIKYHPRQDKSAVNIPRHTGALEEFN